MAVVYLARDLKHERQVAIKTLRPELAASVGNERFLQEIRLTANLTHPLILQVYDSGAADGILYYVMPYVEGESLRDRLNREHQLSLDAAILVTTQIADALSYAHSRGVIHRDIKPENVLFEAGHAMIADFGIARAFDTATHITGTGVALGTPEYMSPELAAGEEPIDGRSDLYSLGCVLFEMLAGEPPFTGASSQAVIAKRMVNSPPEVRVVRETVPPHVARALQRSLARVPADRYATAAAFSEALTASEVDELDAPTMPHDAPPNSIAVLPFANLSADPENEYFSDGVAEDIINMLSQIPSLRVAARTSSFALRERNRSVREIGEELNVQLVLDGSVRRAGNQLRITAQLTGAKDGYHLWSERYDREMKDVFAVQDEIAAAITDRLKVRLLSNDMGTLARRGTENLDAYHLYLKGRHFWYQRALPKAIQYFEQALAVDPDYALGHAGLADSYCLLAFYGFYPSTEARKRAQAAAERARAIDNKLAEASYSMGLTRLFFDWDFRGAQRSFSRSIASNARFAPSYTWLAQLHGFLGKSTEAIEMGMLAQQIEPLSPLINAVVGLARFIVRDYDGAIEACERALEIDPNWGPALGVLSLAHAQQGRLPEAITTLERGVAVTNRAPLGLMWLAGIHVKAGKDAVAREILNELESRGKDGYVPPVALAWIHLYLGQNEPAAEHLAAAFRERNPAALYVIPWPDFQETLSEDWLRTLCNDAGLAEMLAAWS